MIRQPSRVREISTGFMLFALVFVSSLVLFPLSIVALHAAMPRFTEAIPHFLTNLLFFWPQLMLLPGGIGTPHTVFGQTALFYAAIVLWIAVAFAFAWYTRTRRWLLRAFLIFPVVITVALLAHTGLALFGLHARLEGP